MGSTEEPERKRRHFNSISPPLKKQSSVPSSEEKKVDAAVLQYQNQKLAQQLDAQKNEFHILESKFNQLKSKQAAYDDTLITVNRAWNQLVDDLHLLAIRAGEQDNVANILENSLSSKEKFVSSPPEETFLHRLLGTVATDHSGTNGSINHVEEALELRQASTLNLMKHLVENIDLQRSRNEELSLKLQERLSIDDASKELIKLEGVLRLEVKELRAAVDALHIKHRNMVDEMQTLKDTHAKDQVTIKQLTGDLEETMAELEESRRKLSSLKTQKDAIPGVSIPVLHSGIKHDIGEKLGDRNRELRDIEGMLEATKALAESRLSELQEAHEEKLNILKQLEHLQENIKDENHVLTSRPYILLSEQLQHLKAETDRYHSRIESLQAERDNLLRREKEMSMKLESADLARKAAATADAHIVELEAKLQECMDERNKFEIRLEEANQESGRKDLINELEFFVSTLHKQMNMVQAQLKRYKDTAREIHTLRADVHSLTAILSRKSNECKNLSEKCSAQASEVKSLKAEIKELRETEQELKLILDMYGREFADSRDVMEIRQSECKAWAQVEILKSALDEHSLELRVKAANEAEAACQQRLAAAEAEIASWREKLDISERDVFELTAELKAKNEEGEAYLSEIESIGQAYEDMQAQNHRLLLQVTESENHNIKLVSESVKAKQQINCLHQEKQTVLKQLQNANATVEASKQRISRLEEQLRLSLDQVSKATDESRQHALTLESTKINLSELERELHSVKSAAEATRNELQQTRQKMSDVQVELENERYGKKRIEEDLMITNNKLARINARNDATTIEKLSEEIKQYKAILKCGVCHNRPKQVVITKCFHLFCEPCIKRNLEIRHRKCPGCGTGFGQNDVRTVYI
eukprot:TRINITY_DN10287_c0_g1_i1.p1 TRINITY_DN10287_c0_g1~~TRINITY_DN10287_c0_g1_i1.p1  ORF type:complete len:879 (+),score=230.01 TRINITY_DN10287_c0_g1_i1:295-2931(+)